MTEADIYVTSYLERYSDYVHLWSLGLEHI